MQTRSPGESGKMSIYIGTDACVILFNYSFALIKTLKLSMKILESIVNIIKHLFPYLSYSLELMSLNRSLFEIISHILAKLLI